MAMQPETWKERGAMPAPEGKNAKQKHAVRVWRTH